jgi:hypothetical protein
MCRTIIVNSVMQPSSLRNNGIQAFQQVSHDIWIIILVNDDCSSCMPGVNKAYTLFYPWIACNSPDFSWDVNYFLFVMGWEFNFLDAVKIVVKYKNFSAFPWPWLRKQLTLNNKMSISRR